MKKKVKLFTTIASLCLAIALMAFGVYAAATQVTATVNGSISFTATNIDGYWSFEATVTGGTFADGETTHSVANVKNTSTTLPNVTVNGADGNLTVEITITATFHNQADANVKAAITAENKSTGDATNGALTVTPGTNATQIAGQATGSITSKVKFVVTNDYQAANVEYSLEYKAVTAA